METESTLNAMTELVANVTHELRTPVNGIMSNTLELLEEETDIKCLQKLRMIERECKEIQVLIDNILDFAKLDAGKFTIEKREFRFRDMMEYVKANHIHRITEKDLDFEMVVSQEIPEYVIGDELRIGEILNNLLSNACKFTSVGSIFVEVAKRAQAGNRMELSFVVQDTGIGIEKEAQNRLFERFSQGAAVCAGRYGGTGLGLSISKQLIELMDGNISVQSETGKGTVFSFQIWVDVAQNECKSIQSCTEMTIPLAEVMPVKVLFKEQLFEFGSEENRREINKKITSLISSMDKENWETAEMLMESVKQLTESAPKEIKKVVLCLKMAVQKEDYSKALAMLDTLEKELR